MRRVMLCKYRSRACNDPLPKLAQATAQYARIRQSNGINDWEGVMFNGCCAEPSLEELFGDVAMQLLMRRDGITEGDVRALLWKAKGARAAAFEVDPERETAGAGS